jgi:tetratricopeptide (TPR) repeat protein
MTELKRHAESKRNRVVSKKPPKQADKVDRSTKKKGPRLYTLEVLLTDGPATKEFVRANPTISRTIQIRGDQTLQDLHGAINDAFDWEDDRLYAFYPTDVRVKKAGLKELAPSSPIDSLTLPVGRAALYHSDFGAQWVHEIKLTTVGEPESSKKYPKTISKVGESPPQFAELEKEDWDEDSEEEMPEAAAADVSLLIGEMHLKAGEYIKAVEAFTRSIEANPAASDEYEGRSRAYRALADEDERKAKQLRAGLS